jgi:hypothetical protein
MRTAMHDKEKNPTVIEAYVDPFEPIMPPKAKPEFLEKMSKAFEREFCYLLSKSWKRLSCVCSQCPL